MNQDLHLREFEDKARVDSYTLLKIGSSERILFLLNPCNAHRMVSSVFSK